MKTYPAFLVGLEARRCVIVGRTEIAAQKVRDLKAAGAASIDVVATDPVPSLLALVDGKQVRLHSRPYESEDLDGAGMVITTDRDSPLNARIWADANARGVLMNAADDPPHCHFFAGAVIRRGDLVVSISTGGQAPALAVRLRERIERELGPEIEAFMSLAERIRPIIMSRVGNFEARRSLWYRLVDSEVLDLLRSNDESAAWNLAMRLVDAAADAP